MKSTPLLTLVFIFLLSANTQAQWKKVTPNSSFQKNHANLAVIDSTHFHITRVYAQGPAADTNKIKPKDLRTDNGGLTWLESPYYSENPLKKFQQTETGFDISFVDKNNGFYMSDFVDMALPTNNSVTKKIYATTNGGQTWTTAYPTPWEPQFLVPSSFVLSYNADFESTTSGVIALDSSYYYPGIGGLWQRKKLNTRILEVTKGQMPGNYYLTCRNGRIYFTENAFLNMDSSAYLPNFSDSLNCYIHFVAAPANYSLFVATYNSSTKTNRLFKSSNNGKAWVDISQNIQSFFPNGSSNRIDCGSFADATNGILAGEGGAIITHDGGNTWTKMTGMGYASKCESKKQGNRVTAVAINRDSIYTYSYTAVVQPSAIQETSAATDFVLYPNPAKTEVIIEGRYREIKIKDLAGRDVPVVEKEHQTISLINVENGIYTFQIFTENGIITRKVLVQK